MNEFIPGRHRVLIEPINTQGVIQTNEKYLEEAGIVKKVGDEVSFVKEGDTLFFLAHGCDKTANIDGKEYYVVDMAPEFILGKYEKKEE